MAKRQSLESWVGEALTDTDKEGFCTAMTLVHNVGAGEKEIHAVKFAGGKQWKADELANLFHRKAETYAQDLVGSQLFTLHAFYGTSQEVQASHPFRIQGDLGMDGGIGSTEGPTPSGLLTQMMRHTEVNQQVSLRAISEANATLLQITQQMANENLHLRKENFESLTALKQVGLSMIKEKQEADMARLAYERSSKERKAFLDLVPAFVNQIAGVDVIPQATEDTKLIELIAENITADKIEKLMEIFPPALLGPIAARLEKFEKAKREREAADLEAVSGLTAEEDIGGGRDMSLPGKGESDDAQG